MSARRVVRGAVPNGGVRRVRGAMRPAVFDPNARDADGDGRVQDSTRFERPGLPSAPKPIRSESATEGKPKPPKSQAEIDREEEYLDAFHRLMEMRREDRRPNTYGQRNASPEQRREIEKRRQEREAERRRLEAITANPPKGIRDNPGLVLSNRPKPQIGFARMPESNTGPETMSSLVTTGKPSTPSKPKSQLVLEKINKNASSDKFDAAREYGDYETKFPKHEVDGTMRRDDADLVRMREMMKDLIKEARQSGVQYEPLSRMTDADLQEFWDTLNAMKEPETRAQFLAMMLADFELGMRKLGRARAKSGPGPMEDPAKVNKILDNLRGRNLI